VEHGLMPPFAAWENFYVIVGSSAAALMGLQFVVTVLAAGISLPSAGLSTNAFSTPTIVHFCAALLISGIVSAPWHTVFSPSLALAAVGVTGLGYSLLILRRVRRYPDYALVLEDWIWHIVLPLVAYVALLVNGILLPGDAATCLFIVGASALLLLFVGIHNAWDAVTYIAIHRRAGEKAEPSKPT
jgi:hypothetical protein